MLSTQRAGEALAAGFSHVAVLLADATAAHSFTAVFAALGIKSRFWLFFLSVCSSLLVMVPFVLCFARLFVYFCAAPICLLVSHLENEKLVREGQG